MPQKGPTRVRLRRLLDLYPAAAISGQFDTDANKAEAVAELALTREPEEILAFARAHHWLTHQHIHLYELGQKRIDELPDDPLGLPRLYEEDSGKGERSWYYFLDTTYEVIMDDPLGRESLDFLWPLLIHCTKDRLLFSFTILQTSLRPYLPDGRPVVRAGRSITENKVRETALARMHLPDARPFEFNAGIKALWEAGQIDAPSVQYKRELGASTDVMDEDFLLKRDDPDSYHRAIDGPLLKTLFHWVGSQKLGVQKFTAHPTHGTLSFRSFSEDLQGVPGVINAILESN